MTRKHIEAMNGKAKAIEQLADGETPSCSPMQGPPAMPQGCSTVFDTGWETNPRPTSPIGNCQASVRDYNGCAGDCWWPAQNPDGLTDNTDFHEDCALIARDFRKLKYD